MASGRRKAVDGDNLDVQSFCFGGGTSRPGGAPTAVLSRRLDNADGDRHSRALPLLTARRRCPLTPPTADLLGGGSAMTYSRGGAQHASCPSPTWGGANARVSARPTPTTTCDCYFFDLFFLPVRPCLAELAPIPVQLLHCNACSVSATAFQRARRIVLFRPQFSYGKPWLATLHCSKPAPESG